MEAKRAIAALTSRIAPLSRSSSGRTRSAICLANEWSSVVAHHEPRRLLLLAQPPLSVLDGGRPRRTLQPHADRPRAREAAARVAQLADDRRACSRHWPRQLAHRVLAVDVVCSARARLWRSSQPSEVTRHERASCRRS